MISLAAIAAAERDRRGRRARELFANGNISEADAQADYQLWAELAAIHAGEICCTDFGPDDYAAAAESSAASAARAAATHPDDAARAERAAGLAELAAHRRMVATLNQQLRAEAEARRASSRRLAA